MKQEFRLPRLDEVDLAQAKEMVAWGKRQMLELKNN